MPHAPLQTFIIYARADEAHKNELLRHLKGTLIASGDLRVWQDGNLLPGEDWEKSIKRNLKQSDLVLVLVSSDSLGSDFINTEELRMALEQRAEGRTTVVPIILRSCLWSSHPILRGLQGLPKNMKPVKSYADPDEAWTEVLEGLERILLEIREKSELPKENLPTPTLPPAESPAEEAAWKMAARLDAEAAYRHYLEDFPKGKYNQEARKRLIEITPKEILQPKLVVGGPLQILRDCPDCPEMVFVKGGTFMMGSEDGEVVEIPIRQVTLSDFYIGKYPVTFEEYDCFCEATKHPKPKVAWGRGRCPVININWEDANAYCIWLSEKTKKKYRLPTEAEWEFAARGGVKSKGFKFGNKTDSKEIKFEKNLHMPTRIVGENPPNELGLFDMIGGNVWEWCSDLFGDYPNRVQKNFPEYSRDYYHDRIVRSGGYFLDAKGTRFAYRWHYKPTLRIDSVGFRLALSLAT